MAKSIKVAFLTNAEGAHVVRLWTSKIPPLWPCASTTVPSHAMAVGYYLDKGYNRICKRGANRAV